MWLVAQWAARKVECSVERLVDQSAARWVDRMAVLKAGKSVELWVGSLGNW